MNTGIIKDGKIDCERSDCLFCPTGENRFTCKNCLLVVELLNSDIQSNGASPMQPDSSTSAGINKALTTALYKQSIQHLESRLKEKEDEIRELKKQLELSEIEVQKLIYQLNEKI